MDDVVNAMAKRRRLAEMVGGSMLPQQDAPPVMPDINADQLSRYLQPHRPQQPQQAKPYDPADYLQNLPYRPDPNAPPMQATPMPHRYDPSKPVDPNMLKLLRGQ